MLEFCPVCRGLLQIKNEGGKNIGVCSCGFKRMSGISMESEDKTLDGEKNNFLMEGVVTNSSEEVQVEHICKKCGYDKAEVSEIAANESSIFIYKCLKCGNSEREVQGSSKF